MEATKEVDWLANEMVAPFMRKHGFKRRRLATRVFINTGALARCSGDSGMLQPFQRLARNWDELLKAV
jgi:hypothetical protein